MLVLLTILAGCTLGQRDTTQESSRDIKRTLVREESRQEIVETAEGPKKVTLITRTTETEMTQEEARMAAQMQFSSPALEQGAQLIGSAAGGLSTGGGSLLMLAGAWAAREFAPRAIQAMRRPPPPAPLPPVEPQRPLRRREDDDDAHRS